MKKLLSATLDGFEAKVVEVEGSIHSGLPSLSIIGLVSASIKESSDRIKASLINQNFKFPPKKITINLYPSDLSKTGSHFDLSIALLIVLNESDVDLKDWFVFGELGLDGTIKDTNFIYPLILSLSNQNLIKKAIIPHEALEKLSKIPNIELYPVKNIKEAIDFFKNEIEIKPIKNSFENDFKYIEINNKKYFYMNEYDLDFKDVKAQEVAKRAALIAAAGFHNILLEGSPGCGKSMIAQRLCYILPPLTQEEILEIAKIEALDNKKPSFKPQRKFISPHHTSTSASIFGGGSSKVAKIGEVGLAHLGELFFDELPYFNKNILEALREPMQDGKIKISRVNSKITYNSKFLFVGAMNPCPCGNLLDDDKECRCSELEVKRYKNRLSDPFLDRIDLYITMQKVKKDDKASYSSKELHQKVIEAFEFSKKRNQDKFNAHLSDEEIEKFCILDDEAKRSLDLAIDRFSLSFRTIKSILKVSRTIADLENSKIIKNHHLLEALSFRRRK